jgi:hypothetical protein
MYQVQFAREGAKNTTSLRAAPLSHRTVRNMIYSALSYTVCASQPFANKLSTSPPSANGDDCGNVENFLHKNQRKSVTYLESGFHMSTDHLLINPLKNKDYVACRGSRTPYPQKRQQTLGATITPLWKSPESHFWDATNS